MTLIPMRPNAGYTRTDYVRLFVGGVVMALFLASCGKAPEPEVDVSALRVQCEKESGFSGSSQLVPETGTAFVWRADGAEVAECQDGVLVGILGSNHPGD